MALLDSFELVKDIKEGPFITLRNTTITFSKVAIENLGYAEYVHMYIGTNNRQVAFQPCKKDESALTFFVKPEKGKQLLVRITGKAKVQMIMELAGIKDCGKGIRLYGTYHKEENLLIISLKSLSL